MSMSVGGGEGGYVADINVTPMVDVMLVLLIIFMLIAPMLQSGVSVTLPKSKYPDPDPNIIKDTSAVVAIPAVWAFNIFTNKVEGFTIEMDNSSSELIDYFIKRRELK